MSPRLGPSPAVPPEKITVAVPGRVLASRSRRPRPATSPTSDRIPIPASRGGRRAPAEARGVAAAEEVLWRYELEDLRMYARIVEGMRRSRLHPLSQRSLESVVRTRHGWPDEDLANEDWEASCDDARDEEDAASPRRSTRTTMRPAGSAGDASPPDRGFLEDPDDEDDGCIFALEL